MTAHEGCCPECRAALRASRSAVAGGLQPENLDAGPAPVDAELLRWKSYSVDLELLLIRVQSGRTPLPSVLRRIAEFKKKRLADVAEGRDV